MKTYHSNPEELTGDFWDGTLDGEVATHLRSLGFVLAVQTDLPKALVKKINDMDAIADDDQTEEPSMFGPADKQLVAVGPDMWNSAHVTEGEFVHVSFYDADGEKVDKQVEGGYMRVRSVDPSHLAKHYHQ